MNETYYDKGTPVLYNNRPLHRMGDKPGTPAARILKQLRGEMTVAQVADMLKIEKWKAENTLHKMARRGLIQRLAKPTRFRQLAEARAEAQNNFVAEAMK